MSLAVTVVLAFKILLWLVCSLVAVVVGVNMDLREAAATALFG